MSKQEEEQPVSAAAIRTFSVSIFCGMSAVWTFYFPSVRESEEFARSHVRCAAQQVCYCGDESEPRPKCLGG